MSNIYRVVSEKIFGQKNWERPGIGLGLRSRELDRSVRVPVASRGERLGPARQADDAMCWGRKGLLGDLEINGFL